MAGISIPTGTSMKIANVPAFDLDNIDADHPFHENHDDDDYKPPTLELVRELVASDKVGGGEGGGGVTNKGEGGNVGGGGGSCSTSESDSIEEVDIDVALASSVRSSNSAGDNDGGTQIDGLNAFLRRPSLNVLEIDGDDYEDSDDGSEGEETKSKAKKHKSGGGHGGATNMKYFYVVLICSFLLITVDVLFSFTILQPHAASKVNTTCLHSCADHCLTVCSIDDHGTGSGGGGGGSGVEH
tara:strand:- start:136 stop:858 length:723 start_codon:yes stop_codon:yes gene_type:complete